MAGRGAGRATFRASARAGCRRRWRRARSCRSARTTSGASSALSPRARRARCESRDRQGEAVMARRARADGRGYENAQATSGCLRHRHHGMSQLAVFDCTIKPTAAVPADLRHRASLARTCVGGVSSSSAASHQVLRICPVWLVGPPGWSWSTIRATWTAPTDRRSCCCGKARNRESPQMLSCVAERVAAIA